jgi:uroporphyrin-III C-methyltransferase
MRDAIFDSMRNMDDDTASPASMPALPTPRRAPLRYLRAIIGLVALVLIGIIGYVLWQSHVHAPAPIDLGGEVQQLRTDATTQARGIDQTHRDITTLRSRLDDADKVNSSLREQVLALSERARLAEDALANLADKRLSGHDAMLLDEGEMLLALGAERYSLFRDPASTIAAYRHADEALSQVDDATFSTVRQSISADIETLDKLGGADTNVTLAKIAELRSSTANLPVLQPIASEPEHDSRWWQVFGQFVRVRHGDDAQALVARHAGGLARELINLDLREAEAALLARDESRYRNALSAAHGELAAAFDRNDANVVAAIATIEGLSKAVLAPSQPEVLGSALKELRNLRATHALRAPAKRENASAASGTSP